nr:hypothetical protein [Burkholderia pseudomultivorans]
MRNPFKQCPGRQNEALFNSLLGRPPENRTPSPAGSAFFVKAAQKGALLLRTKTPNPVLTHKPRAGFRSRRARQCVRRSILSFAAADAKHRASQPFAAEDGESPFGRMRDIIPRDVPLGEAMALLAGLLVKCIDEEDLRTAQELMKHELFNSRTLEGVVLYARRKTESALLERINALHEQIAERAEERDMSLAHLAMLQAEQRERQDQAKRERQKAIKPAQAARLAGAKNSKIIEEFNRRRRNGEDFQGRNVCSDIATRFGVTADHVRKLKRTWLAG